MGDGGGWLSCVSKTVDVARRPWVRIPSLPHLPGAIAEDRRLRNEGILAPRVDLDASALAGTRAPGPPFLDRGGPSVTVVRVDAWLEARASRRPRRTLVGSLAGLPPAGWMRKARGMCHVWADRVARDTSVVTAVRGCRVAKNRGCERAFHCVRLSTGRRCRCHPNGPGTRIRNLRPCSRRPSCC